MKTYLYLSRIYLCTHTDGQTMVLTSSCLINCSLSSFKGPNCSDWKQPMYLGFEKDVFKTIADYYGHLKEPLLTFHLFDAFVSVLGGEINIYIYIAVYLHGDTESSCCHCLQSSINKSSEHYFIFLKKSHFKLSFDILFYLFLFYF